MPVLSDTSYILIISLALNYRMVKGLATIALRPIYSSVAGVYGYGTLEPHASCHVVLSIIVQR
jgi:hypothetical protein